VLRVNKRKFSRPKKKNSQNTSFPRRKKKNRGKQTAGKDLLRHIPDQKEEKTGLKRRGERGVTSTENPTESREKRKTHVLRPSANKENRQKKKAMSTFLRKRTVIMSPIPRSEL